MFRFGIKGKKGAGEYDILTTNIIFFVLNTIFFLSLILFASRASTGVLIYEQAYSKDLALLLDNAKPGMDFSINIDSAIEVAKKNSFEIRNSFIINSVENSVTVSLASNGGYKTRYFSNLGVDIEIKENLLTLKTREKTEEEKKLSGVQND